MSKEKDSLTDHDYDGIREYDNPLPDWWLFTFAITVIFGFIYWIHYQFGGAATQLTELKQDLAAYQTAETATSKNTQKAPETEEDLQKLMGVSTVVAKGKNIFASKCAVCHGNELQGNIGPNLVDDYWIHGKGKMTDILDVVRKGVTDKGMPAWSAILTDDEIHSAVAYIGANRGTHPANPKPPQGEKFAHP